MLCYVIIQGMTVKYEGNHEFKNNLCSPHKWIVLFERADWLLKKRIISTIYLRTAVETKLRVERLISNHFSVLKEINEFNGICVVSIETIILMCGKRIFNSSSNKEIAYENFQGLNMCYKHFMPPHFSIS